MLSWPRCNQIPRLSLLCSLISMTCRSNSFLSQIQQKHQHCVIHSTQVGRMQNMDIRTRVQYVKRNALICLQFHTCQGKESGWCCSSDWLRPTHPPTVNSPYVSMHLSESVLPNARLSVTAVSRILRSSCVWAAGVLTCMVCWQIPFVWCHSSHL